jgi:hypothetical protein
MSDDLPAPKRKRGRPPANPAPKIPLAEREGLLNRNFAKPTPQVEPPRSIRPPALVPEVPPDLMAAMNPEPPPPPPAALTATEREALRELLKEYAKRQKDALKLFVPMPEQERFFESDAGERIALGGNRGGKTTVTCVEIARAVRGEDPHDKYPKESGRAVLVGKDLIHCSKVFYRKLFRPGAFKIIRDRETHEWRTFRPNDIIDMMDEDQAEPAPPLIPSSFVKSISWENKKEEIPKTITLKNGWELCFFSSIGAPPQGWDVDLVGFDEEIEHPLWYREMSARLLDRRKKNWHTGKVKSGKFIWSATPQAGTATLYELKRRADREVEDGVEKPSIEAFAFGLLQNTHMSQEAINEFVNKLRDDEEEYRVRVLGEFALVGTRVYGEFTPQGPHGCDSFPIPPDWTLYASLDPGRQVCAILFAACPPPGLVVWVETKDGPVCLGKDRVFLFDECYIKKANAEIVATKVAERLGGRRIEKWYIDARAGRITEIGSGKTHEQQYREAFVRHGVFDKPSAPKKIRPTGFVWSTMSGGDDVKAGIEAVRLGLHLNDDGYSKWCVFRDKLKNFLHEAELYSYKRLPNGLVTDEVLKQTDHLMDDWRYLACAKLRWVRGQKPNGIPGYTNEILAKKRAKAKRQSGFGSSIPLN